MRTALQTALLFALAASATAADPVPKGVVDRLGQPTVSVLQGVTAAEAFRVDPLRAPAKEERPLLAGWPTVGPGKPQDRAFAERLAAVLLEEDAYSAPPANCFFPGVGYRLTRDKETVEVLVCFKCRNLRLRAVDATGKEVRTATGSMQPASYNALLKLTKQAFPDDKEVQALKELAE